MSRVKKRQTKKAGRFRRTIRCGGIPLFLLFVAHAAVATWFVHHPRAWIDDARKRWPAPLVNSLLAVGNPVGDLTDALNLTGTDAVYEYDTDPPSGAVCFAGLPVRTGQPAPSDITVLDRGEFKIGWSAHLHHPVWCAYHVTRDARYETCRKSFHQDRAVASAPPPNTYQHSGYDRGHMVPNHAIVTRYGESAQKKTFLMSNIAPQTPSLNRGAWRNLEHRIADLWTARYGEIWVIVGCLPSKSRKTIAEECIDVPDACYQIVVAQEGLDVRALAVLLPQNIPYGAYPARYLISIDDLEALTGLDFLSELPEFIQSPLEAELPTRLWPIRLQDVVRFISLGFDH